MPKTRSPGSKRVTPRPDLLDDAGDVPADRERRRAEEAAARARLPVDRVDARGGDAHEHLRRRGLRPRDVDELEHLGPAERLLADGAHRTGISSRRRRWLRLRRRAPRSRVRTRSRRRPAARAGRRCTPTTRSSPSRGARPTRAASGSGTRCTSRCRCPRSTWPASTRPYQAVGAWQNRVFAVPPAMGIDYRIVNGYVYISGNPVTDPAKIAERAEFFQRRAGHYYQQLGRALRPVARRRWRR